MSLRQTKMPKKKKFIDKKNAVTFQLVHRSQRDPLQANEDAPQRVLLAVDPDKQKRLEEQRKYGVFFDDDYNYLQHLKDVKELQDSEFSTQHIEENATSNLEAGVAEPRLLLPGSAFGTDVETDIGLLNRAAPKSGPRFDWDPEIVAALDEDFDFEDPENQLDDDFITKANAPGGADDEEMTADVKDDNLDDDFIIKAGGFTERIKQRVNWEGDMNIEPEDEEISGSEDAEFSDDFSDEVYEERKTGMSKYSVTSSVLPRNENLQLLDAQFEKVYEDYGDENIGALDHEELNGRITFNSDLMRQVMEDFEKSQKVTTMRDIVDSKEEVIIMEEEISSDSDVEWKDVLVDTKPKWDCETIISTYSTTSNLPKTIPCQLTERKNCRKSESSSSKSCDGPHLTLREIERQMVEDRRADRTSTFRAKEETPEERRSRKQAVKQERQDRRMEKKSNKLAFRAEHIRQQKQIAAINKNVKGLKLSTPS